MITLAIILIAWPFALLLGFLIWCACQGDESAKVMLVYYALAAGIASLGTGIYMLKDILECAS